MITSTSPLYFEVPEQRVHAVARFLVNNLIYLFLVPSIFVPVWVGKSDTGIMWYLGLAALTALLLVLSAKTVSRLRPVIKSKVSEEFTKNTGIALPDDFNPFALPARAVPATISLIGTSGTEEEWTAARNGTYFRFAPKS